MKYTKLKILADLTSTGKISPVEHRSIGWRLKKNTEAAFSLKMFKWMSMLVTPLEVVSNSSIDLVAERFRATFYYR